MEPEAKRPKVQASLDDTVVGFIGAGQMAVAIIRGIIAAKIRFSSLLHLLGSVTELTPPPSLLLLRHFFLILQRSLQDPRL